MPIRSFDEFLNDSTARNEYVSHPDFKSLYVRHTEMYFNGSRIKTLQIASIEAKKPGKGSFKRLLNQIYPKYAPIYVECVHNEKFAEGLMKLGFDQVTDDPSFVLH